MSKKPQKQIYQKLILTVSCCHWRTDKNNLCTQSELCVDVFTDYAALLDLLYSDSICVLLQSRFIVGPNFLPVI